MGIPAYFSHLIKENRSVLKSISENAELKATHLFLDSNSIIYDVIRSQTYTPNDIATFEKSCIREICKQIKYYITLFCINRTWLPYDTIFQRFINMGFHLYSKTWIFHQYLI